MPAWTPDKLRSLGLLSVLLSCLGMAGLAGKADAQTSDLVSANALRVCADPANHPMSSKDEDGFENRLAELIGEKLELPVQYTWFPMATGFIRNTLRVKKCDLIIGYAQGHELVLNTNHYLTSVYALIVPKDGDLADVETLSDPVLSDRRIGIIAGTPPAAHMARHGLVAKAKPYHLVVDRRHDSPAAEMLSDLAAGEIDAAVLWGPLGGPLVKQDYPDLEVIPLVKEELPPRLFYRITMGVRQGEKVWQRQLNSLIRRNQDEINQILADAGVPLISDLGTEVLDLDN
ncbi:MAG: substrate-binding domain-containing protein [Pseudomonadota bacterium]